jgi:hypothetical protein
MLIKGFAGVIVGKQDIVGFGSVDIAREERGRRVRDCREGFTSIRVQLEELKRSPGYVGVAVRDCLKELLVF